MPEPGRTWCAVWGVWLSVSGGASGKASSHTVFVCVRECVCERVPAHVFSGMAVGQTAAQYGFDFVAHSAATSDILA